MDSAHATLGIISSMEVGEASSDSHSVCDLRVRTPGRTSSHPGIRVAFVRNGVVGVIAGA